MTYRLQMASEALSEVSQRGKSHNPQLLLQRREARQGRKTAFRLHTCRLSTSMIFTCCVCASLCLALAGESP